MSRITRKPVVRVSDYLQHKRGCITIEDGYRLDIFKVMDFTIYEVKTKALISCTVTAQLICAFVFAYARRRFSCDAAYIGVALMMVQVIQA